MKTFKEHWEETPPLAPMNSEEQAQVWFLKGMAEADKRHAVKSNSIDGLESKEFYYFPNVVCECGQAMVHGFNFVHCVNINCENYGVTFGLPKIKLEAL